MDPTDVETRLPPDTLVAFVKSCLDADDKTITNFKGPSPIASEVFTAGWDRFSIMHDLVAKRLVVESCEQAIRTLRAFEALPQDQVSLPHLWGARGRAWEASRAFNAIAATFRDRHGYGKAAAGQWATVETPPAPGAGDRLVPNDVFPPSNATVTQIANDIAAKIGSWGIGQLGGLDGVADQVWDAWPPFQKLTKEQQDVVTALVDAEIYS